MISVLEVSSLVFILLFKVDFVVVRLVFYVTMFYSVKDVRVLSRIIIEVFN